MTLLQELTNMLNLIEYLDVHTKAEIGNHMYGKDVNFIKAVERVNQITGVKNVRVGHGIVVVNLNEQYRQWPVIKKISMSVGTFIDIYGKDN